MSGNKGHNSRVCIYEGHPGRGHDRCRLLRDLCSVGLDPVGHGARVSAKQALLSSAGSKKGGRKRPRAGMTALLFILSLMGGCASAWLCKKYFEPWRRAAWADGGPLSHSCEVNCGFAYYWRVLRWHACDGVYSGGAWLIVTRWRALRRPRTKCGSHEQASPTKCGKNIVVAR